MRYEQDARNGDGAEAVQKIHTDHEMGDYLEPSMLGTSAINDSVVLFSSALIGMLN
jgi:hypothetical protein